MHQVCPSLGVAVIEACFDVVCKGTLCITVMVDEVFVAKMVLEDLAEELLGITCVAETQLASETA